LMIRTLLKNILFGAGLLLVYGTYAHATALAILDITDTSGGSVNCDTSQPLTGSNCLGFIVSGNLLIFTGTVGGFSGMFSVNGSQPGNVNFGFAFANISNLLHNTGTGNLVVDFGENSFSFPTGPPLLLNASAVGNLGQSQATDQQTFQSWGRVDNALVIPGGDANAVAPVCIPGAGLTTACSMFSNFVSFTRGAGNYSITAEAVITQSTADLLPAQYIDRVDADVTTPTPVPEPTTAVLLGAGLLLLSVTRKTWQ
jgi:hypothetical protein